ncbi:MAG: hypothetical protein DMF67_11875 [Acidobacteria bacterium]|nr:MAG: hypothetical protein DMF67_11875 [Acidobacteriota bacterium]
MRDTSPAWRFKGGVAGMKALALALLLAACVLLTACPPDGGDLVPLAGQEGAALATTKFEGDTLSLTRGGVTLKARGLWSVADGSTSVILEVANTNDVPASLDFGRCEVVIKESGQRLRLRSLSNEAAAGGPVFLAERVVRIDGGQSGRFTLEFEISPEGGSSGATRNVLGQTVALRLPAEVERETRAPFDFVFVFKYAEYQRRG